MLETVRFKKTKTPNQKVLAIIPARKGSRRVPHKNTRILGGKPLICWTFEAAKQAKTLSRIIVSTDDEKVKKLAEQQGIEVPFFPRPADISEDVDTALVLRHALEHLERAEGYLPSYVVTLQCTSPFRTSEDVDGCVRAIKNLRDVNGNSYDTVITVTEVQQHPEWMFKECQRGHGRLVPYLNVNLQGDRLVSQNLPKVYYPTGAVYVNVRELITKHGRMFGWNIYGYHVPRERSIDLETEVDFVIAEALLKERRRD